MFPYLFKSQAGRGAFKGGLLAFSLPAAFAAVFTTLVFWIDRLLVGYFLDEASTGIYQAASQLSVAFAVILGGFGRILTPQFANAFALRDYPTLAALYRTGTKWGFYLGLPLILVLLASPARVLETLYGRAYAGGSLVLVILVIGQTINLLTGSVGPLLVMGGRKKAWFMLTGGGLALNLILNILFIPKLGLQGAALGTSISLSLLFIVAVTVAKLKFHLWPYDRRYLKGFLAAGLSGVAVIAVGKILLLPQAAVLAVQCLAAVLVFSGCLVLFGLDEEDREFLRTMRWKNRKMDA
jgi:O-antigen/teichoic acid export membrane protein